MHSGFAKIYDEFMGFVNYNSWKKFILSFAKKGKLNVADLGCGTAAMAYLFAKDGHSVKAFDISETMLDIAKKKNDNNYDIEFKKANIIKEDIGKDYDLIMCNFDTVNYFSSIKDLETFFKNVYSALKDDGIFVFDIIEEGIFEEIFKDDIFIDETDRYLLLMHHQRKSKYKHNIEMKMYIKEDNNMYKKYTEILEKNIFSLDKVFEVIKESGLIVYDNARNKEFGESRIYIICKKQV